MASPLPDDHLPVDPAILAAAPKAELHVHVEGTLTADLAFALARRNGVALPWESPADLRRALHFRDLQGFLDVYYATAAVLRTADDFHDLAWNYLLDARRDNVVRAEIFFDPQTHTARGVPFAEVIGGLSRAIDRAGPELGLSAALVMCFLRHLPEADAIATLEEAAPFRERIIGVGLDSGERGNPPERFGEVFASVHSDDPAFFGGGIGTTYRETAAALGLSRGEARRLLRHSLESAFWEPREATPHVERLEALFGA